MNKTIVEQQLFSIQIYSIYSKKQFRISKTNVGEGSYGSVYKALHKESGQVLAIKQVPVESELGRLIYQRKINICKRM